MKTNKIKATSCYITDALFILMARKKFEDISITEIADKAGVTRVSFYRNFNTKEEVIKTWIFNVTNSFLTKSNISYKNDSLENYFMILFTHLEKYKERAILICKAGLTYLLKNEFENRLLSIYQKEYDNYKSYFIAGGIFNVYYYWLKNGCLESPEDLAKKLVDILNK